MRRLLCIGGHDFSARPEDRALTDLIASLAGDGDRRVCLVPTASGDAAEQSFRFHAALADRGCSPSELSLFRLGTRPLVLRDHLLAQDVIYVGGGSLVNLLAVWEAHDLGAILRLAWEQGVVICGQSAGAMCWFEVGITKGSGVARIAAGLGVLPGTCCVHYRSEPDRRKLLLESVEGGVPGGYGIDDHAALMWTERELSGVYSARPGATVHRVQWTEGRVVETRLTPTALVPSEPGTRTSPEIDEFRSLRRRNQRLARSR